MPALPAVKLLHLPQAVTMYVPAVLKVILLVFEDVLCIVLVSDVSVSKRITVTDELPIVVAEVFVRLHMGTAT